MAHLWIRDEAHRWLLLLLEGDFYALSAGASCPARRLERAHAGGNEPLLGRYRHNGDPESWVLQTGGASAVRVNGSPLHMGLRVLQDRDEIALGHSMRLFFSTEREAKIEPFPGAEHPVYCARCKHEIIKGTPAVRCPRCDSWTEEITEPSEAHPNGRRCWSVIETCPMCDYPTTASGFQWTPEELG